MKNVRIMVVDDDVDMTQAVSAILENDGYSVVVENNGADALRQMRDQKPDLLILDVMMETWQTGFEMSRELKNDPGLKEVPILMMTAIEAKTGIEFKSSAGDPKWLPVDGFLDKPFESQVLLDEVRRLL